MSTPIYEKAARTPEWVRRALAGTLPIKVDMRRYPRHD